MDCRSVCGTDIKKMYGREEEPLGAAVMNGSKQCVFLMIHGSCSRPGAGVSLPGTRGRLCVFEQAAAQTSLGTC